MNQVPDTLPNPPEEGLEPAYISSAMTVLQMMESADLAAGYFGKKYLELVVARARWQETAI